MKLTKEDLKGIVKECLVEILSEGIGSAQLNENRVRTTPSRPATQLSGRTASQQQPVQRQSVYDKMSFVPQREQVQKSINPSKKINPLSMVGDITTDPVLAGVLADTAMKGQHMSMNESNRGPTHEDQVMSSGDQAARMMLNADPIEMFGESSSMWAALAFSEKAQK